MNNEQEMVEVFHKKFKLAINEFPCIVSDKDIALRVELIKEECREFAEASANKDIIGIADAIADLLYVIYGAAVTYGIDANEVFKEVHRSNMTKVWENGTVKHREDGKVIKPPTYKKANIKGLLAKMCIDEYCKYTEIKGNHYKILKICRQNHNNCNQLCAFFIAYNKEIYVDE